MEKGKIRISPKLIALLLAGGIAFAPIEGLAKTDNSYDPGTFVKWVEMDDTCTYGVYIVKEGDNLSRISEKICSHFGIDITTKYWPLLAKINKYPRIIKPGDIILFPKTYKKFIKEFNDLDPKWISEYKTNNKVYGPEKTEISINEVANLLYEIYGEQLECIDPDTINLYLKVTGLDKKYEIIDFDKELNNDELFDLTDYIPTINEIKEYQEAHKTYKKDK
jgi:hypothetical protein